MDCIWAKKFVTYLEEGSGGKYISSSTALSDHNYLYFTRVCPFFANLYLYYCIVDPKTLVVGLHTVANVSGWSV